MNETALAAFILIAIVSSAGVSGNFAFAKTIPTDVKQIEKKKVTDSAKAFADDVRKRALEKTLKETIAKKADLKKQLALEAKALQDAKKKSAIYSVAKSTK